MSGDRKSDGDERIEAGGALEGALFKGFLRQLSKVREPEPGERLGPWKIGRELGRGGSGVVFLAERADGAYQQQVALKWLRGDRPVLGGFRALERERALLASLDHPHIARLVDGGQSEEGMLWFAMDYVAGAPINEHCQELNRSGIVKCMIALSRAVHHAHDRGLIHGDIKPSNVLIDDRGQPRLLDFGIARLHDGEMIGSYGLTPEFASPEQRAGRPLSMASDVWQIGRLLQSLLERFSPARDLDAIVSRATATDPDQRYASASALADDLVAWQESRPVDARNGHLMYRMGRLIRRHQALALVLTIATLVLISGAVWATWQLAAERDLARAEAGRATQALVETEAALARADALRDFLVGLFQATRPSRPRDQLPSTEDLLAAGARRALEDTQIPANERYAMLLTLAKVYMAQNQYERARPLIESVVQLSRDGESLSTTDRARALEQHADLLIRTGDDLERAESLLVEAEHLVSDQPSDWETRARIRLSRSWIERHRGNHALALEWIVALVEQMPGHEPVSAPLRASLLDAAAGLYRVAGELGNAARFRTRATRAFREYQGAEGQGHVVSLANSVGLERDLGRFDQAVERAREVIALYDRIYPEPVDYRATVRLGLARTLLARGDEAQAFEELDTAAEEYAAFMDTTLERWPLYFSLRGSFHARMNRTDAALGDIGKARDLIRQQGDFDDRLVATVAMLHAWALCRQGDGAGGQAILDDLEHEQTLLGNERNRAQLEEARASCHFSNADFKSALAATERALDAQQVPGAVLATADRLVLKARILDATGRSDDAQQSLEQARRAFLDLGLDDHPRLDGLSIR